MSPLVLAALILTVWEVLGRRLPALPRLNLPRISRPAVALGALALVAGFSGQLILLAFQAGHDGARPDWVSRTPLLFVDEAFPFGEAHGLISFAALGLVVAQTLGLLTLVGAILRGAQGGNDAAPARLAQQVTPFVAAILALLAFGSPAVSSGDVFGYVGLGLLGPHPFERPAHFFTGEYARVFDSWHLRPTIYGPVFTGLNAAVVSLGHTFAGKVLALRALGLVLMLIFAALVHALARSRALTAAVVLNPMLWLQFVTNAHNDLLGMNLLAGALILIARRRPAWAMLLVAAAGLVKFPFVVFGAVAFAREGPRRAIPYAAGAAALCVAVSAAFAGRPYLDALTLTARTRAAFTDPVLNEMKFALSLTTLAVTAFILLRGKFPAFAGWLYTALAPVLFPWYLIWAFWYALAARGAALATVLALPLLATLSDGIYGLDVLAYALPLAAFAWLVLAMRAAPPRRLHPAGG
jgi:hypothetical protein